MMCCEQRPGASPREEKASLEPRKVSAQDLFDGQRELRILHAGEEYRLTITSKGKLILTK